MDTASSLHQFLTLYMWFVLAVLLGFMLLIGRFYQKFSGEATYYWLYMVAIVLFGIFAVRSASREPLELDFISDAFSIIAGALLLFLSLTLHLRMMSKKEDADA